MKNQLKKNIQKYIALDTWEFDDFFSITEHQQIGKKGFFLKEGQVCKHRAFILKGLFRSYYIDKKGNENIIQFGIENWWLTDVESFTKGVPSKIYIQALEESEILSISKEDLELSFQKNQKLERLFRVLTENHLTVLQKKYTYYWQMSSKERYDAFTQALPNFVQRIPQYMIASYLDITPEYLSELRKSK